MGNNKTLSSKSVFREHNREMYAKLLQICILAISIYISVGTPAYVEPADGDKEIKYNENEGASNDDVAPYDGDGGAKFDPEVAKPDDYEGSGSIETNQTGTGEEHDDAELDNKKVDGNEDARPVCEHESASDEDESGYEYEDYGGEKVNLKLTMPVSTEMRDTPELGFDPSNDEMMKLKMWPDAFIPYYIDVYSFNDKVMRDKIRSFLSSVNSLTALNFVELPSPPSNNMRWVFFVNRRGLLGCADHSIRNFTNTGVQQVVLGYHCMITEGELAEAVLAIAGVPAQHNAPDRDNNIVIKEENIIPEKKYLFEKRMDDEWLFHDLEYDFNSAGHFHSFKHSINGRATIETKGKNNSITIGESKLLTASDILKLRMLYNFIVKKKLAPDCQKLFKPGKKFRQYKPKPNQLKARPKPIRYTGESPGAPLNKDDVEVSAQSQFNKDENIIDVNLKIPNDIIPDSKNDTNDQSEKKTENVPILNDDLDEEASNEAEDSDGSNESDGAKKYDQPPSYDNNSGATNNKNSPEEKEYDKLSPSKFSGKKLTIIQHQPRESREQTGPNKPLQFVGYQNSPNEQLKLLNPRNKNTPDLLSTLSDFQTDEEDRRQVMNKDLLPKPSAAKYAPHQKIELKFIPYPG